MNTEDLSSLFFAVRCGEVETVKELLKVKGHSTVVLGCPLRAKGHGEVFDRGGRCRYFWITF